MLRILTGAGVLLLASSAAFAQAADPTLTFEVASVKPAAPMTMGMIRIRMQGGPGTGDPGHLNYEGVPLRTILTNAYGVKRYQISGPSWLDSERFDIVAKIPKDTTKEQFRIMLQNLLAERFKLTLHRETKDLPMYALVVGKNGPKMKETEVVTAPADGDNKGDGGPGAGSGAPPPPPPAAPDGPMRMRMGADGMPKMPAALAGRGGTMMAFGNGRFRMISNKQNMSGLAEALAGQLDRPVTDMTGLTKNYDFTLEFLPEAGGAGPMGMMLPPMPPGGGGGGAAAGGGEGGMRADGGSESAQAPTLFAAVQEQLGLKLEPRKGPVELLVIDHIEKTPTEN